MVILKLMLLAAIAAMFFVLVRRSQAWLLKWVTTSVQPLNTENDRLKELAWWAAIGILCCFLAAADIGVKALLVLL